MPPQIKVLSNLWKLEGSIEQSRVDEKNRKKEKSNWKVKSNVKSLQITYGNLEQK